MAELHHGIQVITAIKLLQVKAWRDKRPRPGNNPSEPLSPIESLAGDACVCLEASIGLKGVQDPKHAHLIPRWEQKDDQFAHRTL